MDPHDIDIRSLENTDFETLFHAFERAFSDYAIRFEKNEIRAMLRRRGYCPALSFAAFDNGIIVAFTLNGIGTYNGIHTAYDTGTGTVPEYRARGIASRIFSFSVPRLIEAGISQYLLEVLGDNAKAISIYRRMGFEVARDFDCFRQSIALINNRRYNESCHITPVGHNTIVQAQYYGDIRPSWQNSVNSILRAGSEITCLGAFNADDLLGYCVVDKFTGDIAQIAVRKDHRRKGIASRLLHEATRCICTDSIKLLNIESDYQPMHSFLESLNIPLANQQFEMTLQLTPTPGN